MKTNDLIEMLAADAGPVDSRIGAQRLITSMCAASVVSLLLLIPWLGLRDDLTHAMGSIAFWWKQLFTLSLALPALLATLRLARPGVPLGRGLRWALAVPLLAVWIAAAYLLWNGTMPQRVKMIQGSSWAVCTQYIAVLSIPIFVATMWSLKALAPTRLRLTGAAAGLLSGATAAAVYCLHCPEVQPPFVAVWYVLGILTPVGVGAIIGPRVLRW
jgi:hypothetical protein